MEIPIAVLVGETMDYKNAEEYTLEQKQEELVSAEQELKKAIDMSQDFFDTKEDMDATIHDILQNPDAVYTKPFMKKIANAALRVTACKQELYWESIVDTKLTPAQIKLHVRHLMETQRNTLEQKMEERMSAMQQQMNADNVKWMKQLRNLCLGLCILCVVVSQIIALWSEHEMPFENYFPDTNIPQGIWVEPPHAILDTPLLDIPHLGVLVDPPHAIPDPLYVINTSTPPIDCKLKVGLVEAARDIYGWLF